MTATQPNFSPRFVRRTQLAANEYHKNFHKLDGEIIAAVTSAEADRVTPLMSKIYLRLVNAPSEYWEREGVLRFEAELRETGHVKAWDLLCEAVGVASATANKALTWLHDRGIIGYFAGKNGVGIRIFLNRAMSSIGVRAPASGQKILRLAPASSGAAPASRNEAAFNDSYAVSEYSDKDLNPHAPKNGADKTEVGKRPPEPAGVQPDPLRPTTPRKGREVVAVEGEAVGAVAVEEIVRRLKCELEPSLTAAASRAAIREHERTREWLETRGLPKAARVAQREAYNVLRNHGVVNASKQMARADVEVGRSHHAPETGPLSLAELNELAEVCIAMHETHGQSIDTTLSEMSAGAGACLSAEDAPKVRELALSMARAGRTSSDEGNQPEDDRHVYQNLRANPQGGG